ncbi:hypothetical protein [Mycobacterium talmoniae]|uniref:hypothetical protein n=1 Tax=Mycobacterium talmoniae TaxID=1858794 RepID=UPI0013049583|nr:hypothetical protein [Mycobacterium talmoniae]
MLVGQRVHDPLGVRHGQPGHLVAGAQASEVFQQQRGGRAVSDAEAPGAAQTGPVGKAGVEPGLPLEEVHGRVDRGPKLIGGPDLGDRARGAGR